MGRLRLLLLPMSRLRRPAAAVSLREARSLALKSPAVRRTRRGGQEWARFQKGMNRREKALAGKSRVSHSVHCPYYTDDKQEFWWVYISDRKTHSLITPPYHLTSLVSEEEVELKFTAPSKEGIYNFTVCVRSDSYLGVDLLEDIKLDVQKAWEAPTEHKQWEFSDDEEDDDGKDASEESEFAEDSEFEDDSD